MIRHMSAICPSLRRLTPVSLVPITLKDLIKLSTFTVCPLPILRILPLSANEESTLWL